MDMQRSKNGSHDLIRIVRERLNAARTPLLVEIRTYPRHIAGCYDQYQNLLKRRQALTQQLGRLHNIATRPELASALSAFIKVSATLDTSDKAHLIRKLG